MPCLRSVPPPIVEDIPASDHPGLVPHPLACSVTPPRSFVLSGNLVRAELPHRLPPLAQRCLRACCRPHSGHRLQEAVVTQLQGWALHSRDRPREQSISVGSPPAGVVLCSRLLLTQLTFPRTGTSPGKNSISGCKHQVPGFSSPLGQS